MIRAVVQHRHKIAITADQHNAVHCLAVNQAHNIHAQIQVQVGLFGSAGERLVILSGNAIAQAFDRLQKHLVISRLRAGRAIGLRTYQAAIATQEVQQLTKIDRDTQGARRVE